MITLKSFVNGEWVEGQGELASLVNPTNEEVVARTGTGGIDFAQVLDFARHTGGPGLRAMTFAQRGSMLKAMSKAIYEARESLIEASILNAGTPRSDAKFDIDGASGTLAYYASLGKSLGERTLMVEESEPLMRNPRFVGTHLWSPLQGAAVHINAFNFPAWGIAEKAACALLAGVPVITKPATATALLAFRLMEVFVAADVMPAGALQFVSGSTGDLLTHLGPQDALAFTGSGATGTYLRGLDSILARSVRVNVEADSLNSMVLAPGVSSDDDVYAMFLRDAAKEITQKSGQKCTATRRIFVPSEMIDQVQSDLAERLGDLVVGDPALKEVRMGPLATAQQLRDYRAGVAQLVESGARIVYGDPEKCEATGVEAGKGYFVGPLLLRADDAQNAHAVHEHEVFGPCATLMPYGDVDEAVALVARGGGGLVASVYGDDRKLLPRLVLGIAPHHGRVLMGSKKIADSAISPGMVLPSCVHGGPGRAGGGEELGGERGLRFYQQRTAIQGDRALLEKFLQA